MAWESIKRDDVKGLERFIELISPHNPIYAEITVPYIQKLMGMQKVEVWKDEETGMSAVFKTLYSRVGEEIKTRNRLFIVGIPETLSLDVVTKTLCKGMYAYNQKNPGKDFYVAIHHVGCIQRMRIAYDYIINKIGNCETLENTAKRVSIRLCPRGIKRLAEN